MRMGKPHFGPTAFFRLFLASSFVLAFLICAGSARAQNSVMGEWGAKFDLPNVAVHVEVLPTGKVLFWGRREQGEDLNPHNCTPRIWDPSNNTFTLTPQPGFNLFCSGAAFLADGRLLVAGGHITDGHGEPRSAIYDPNLNTWTNIDNMNAGRWYPTVVSLPNGTALVSSGSDENGNINVTQQIEKDGHWNSIVTFDTIALYPRMQVAPDGRVFMSGPLSETYLLDTNGGGEWAPLSPRINGFRDYAPSVMYDVGKVLYIGGGLPPTNAAEIINLNDPSPQWKSTSSMTFARRHHNATILPDGTVLVTGGTSGSGGPNPFDDESAPVKASELWDPNTGKWAVMASEDVPRLYHSTAVLLPDARVLSAGGGEYALPNGQENAPENSHRDAQIFSPSYLFRGPRPDVTSAPSDVTYGSSFTVGTPHPDLIGQVNWIRLSSVTHAFNQGQSINFLKFASDGTNLNVTAPANSNLCPPGFYMLFTLSKDGVPSTAKIIRVHQ